MKSVCSIHEQAYEVGEHCPYCDFPAEVAAPTWAQVSPYPLVFVELAPGKITAQEQDWSGGNWAGSSQPASTIMTGVIMDSACDHRWTPCVDSYAWECRKCRSTRTQEEKP